MQAHKANPVTTPYVTEEAKLYKKLKMSREWYVAYTRPRWEKKVDKLLRERGMECYCPLHKVRRRWSDRVKLIELPLLNSYIFVHINQLEMPVVRNVPGVLNFVYWNGKPAVVKALEILAIRRFLDTYEDVEARRLDIRPGDKITIVSGLLMDYRGKVLEVKNKTVKIRLEGMGYELVAYVNKTKLVNQQQDTAVMKMTDGAWVH